MKGILWNTLECLMFNHTLEFVTKADRSKPYILNIANKVDSFPVCLRNNSELVTIWNNILSILPNHDSKLFSLIACVYLIVLFLLALKSLQGLQVTTCTQPNRLSLACTSQNVPSLRHKSLSYESLQTRKEPMLPHPRLAMHNILDDVLTFEQSRL